MIAIPNFLFGAMENWGLITYRDWNLLFKPNVSSSANKQRVAEVVSHELAHQVFCTYSLGILYGILVGGNTSLKSWSLGFSKRNFISFPQFKLIKNAWGDFQFR